MKATLVLDGRTSSGGSPLICHNERLADPLDEYTKALKAASPRKKTERDHLEMARIEFLGGLYTEPPLTFEPQSKATIGVPAWNIIRCLQEGAKRSKRGRDVIRGVFPLVEFVPLSYDGPKTAKALYEDGGFTIRKGVGVGQSKVIRTRPLFPNWQAELPIQIDEAIFDLDNLKLDWEQAGKYAGLGDMRPIHGRFAATIEVAS